jgi:hypothetical protein
MRAYRNVEPSPKQRVLNRKQREDASAHVSWGELLIIIGLMGTLAGSIDLLEGVVFVLPGVALISLGTVVSKSRLARLAFWSCILTATGVVCMIALSALGGVGGDSGRSIWWSALLTPYAFGAVLSFIAGAVALMERLSGDGNSVGN